MLAHKAATTLEAHHAVEIIEQAFAKFGIPGIVNSDQGSQFMTEAFTSAILARGVKLSMTRSGAWRDTVFVDRRWRSVKYERVYLPAYDRVSDAQADITQYIDWYNAQRGHTRLERDQTLDAAYWKCCRNEKSPRRITVTGVPRAIYRGTENALYAGSFCVSPWITLHPLNPPTFH